MKIECKDLVRVLRGEDPELTAALNAHAETCPSCREEIRLWSEIPAAASQLRKTWESDGLWTRIRQALAEESQTTRPKVHWTLSDLFTQNWQAIIVVASLLLISLVSTRIVLRHLQPADVLPKGSVVGQVAPKEKMDSKEKRLLTEQALSEVETAESAYYSSIEKLSKQVEAELQNPTSPLLINYREKLMLLDAAIAECRANINQNRFNAHLRKELLSIYQEKHRTLQALLKEETHEQ